MLAVRVFPALQPLAYGVLVRRIALQPTKVLARGFRQAAHQPSYTFPRIRQNHSSSRGWKLSRQQNRNGSGQRRCNSTRERAQASEADPTSNIPESQLSWSQRFRKLSREYGWSAMGVYFGLSVLDFPFCFAAVRMLGTDRVGRWEHAIVSKVRDAAAGVFPGLVTPMAQKMPAGRPPGEAETLGGTEPEWSWGVEEAEKAHENDATIWTQLALAYAIHKSFIFVRVPLTVAVTPKVVKTLRGWGWDIGKRKPKIKAPKD